MYNTTTLVCSSCFMQDKLWIHICSKVYFEGNIFIMLCKTTIDRGKTFKGCDSNFEINIFQFLIFAPNETTTLH